MRRSYSLAKRTASSKKASGAVAPFFEDFSWRGLALISLAGVLFGSFVRELGTDLLGADQGRAEDFGLDLEEPDQEGHGARAGEGRAEGRLGVHGRAHALLG